MFEKFNVPAAYMSVQAVLALYATGRTTGAVLDTGASVTHTVAVFEGYVLGHGTQALDVAGDHVDEYLCRSILSLFHGSWKERWSKERKAACEIKEMLAYVATSGADADVADSKEYTLPDGKVITIGSERSRCPEALFKPSLIKQSSQGIHEALFTTISACDVDMRKDLYKNIVVTGGSSLLPGLPERLAAEMRTLAPAAFAVKVVAPPETERKFGAWIGGSILASMSSFESMWITKGEYDESGPGIVQRKCF